MNTIKRLDVFLLKSFLPLFLMTFGICLFIFLMQFVWRFVDEIVGKGLEFHILVELFFYAALTFVPQALPLSILFASLMTFGNLGENFELLAMKSSGISLLRIMRPITIFLIFVAISAFFFQNNIIPVTQVRFYTIMYSVKQQSLELSIPESIFSSEIPGYNVYVKGKDKERRLLKDIMIYDYTKGASNITIILADSGRLSTSTDKRYLVMTLYNGESFANFNNDNKNRSPKEVSPYKRETFDTMDILIEFDTNFNLRDESIFEGRYIGKNLNVLLQSIDSMTVKLDSIKKSESQAIYAQSYRRTMERQDRNVSVEKADDSVKNIKKTVNFDSLYIAQDPNIKASLLSYAKRNIENFQMNYGFKSETLKFEEGEMRRHHTEMHRKFTLSFACLIFMFIGAPLGAIIKKGGLGAPAVLSVLLFVVYYIIDTFGYKMARDGVWIPWEGMWLSSAVLLSLGVFLTYKAVNDSELLNAEIYLDFIRRVIGKREYRKTEKKEVIISEPDYNKIKYILDDISAECMDYLSNNKRWLNYISFWKHGGMDEKARKIAFDIEDIAEQLGNSDRILVLNKTMDLPIINNYKLMSLDISPQTGKLLAVVFPVGGLLYLVAVYRRKILNQDIKTTIKVCNELRDLTMNYEL